MYLRLVGKSCATYEDSFVSVVLVEPMLLPTNRVFASYFIIGKFGKTHRALDRLILERS